MQISCPAPYLDAGLYSVYVALNGENFVNDGLKVFYQEKFLVYSIAPTFGVLGKHSRASLRVEHSWSSEHVGSGLRLRYETFPARGDQLESRRVRDPKPAQSRVCAIFYCSAR